MASFVTRTFSDIDMHCPPEWENGYKAARVSKFGDGDRVASNIWTGEWQGAQYDIEFEDTSGFFRRAFASATDRYFGRAWTVKMTTRENRAVLGDPYTVFHGPVVDAQPVPGRKFKFTLGDIVSQGMLADDGERGQVPWRKIRDCGLLEKDSDDFDFEVSEDLELDHPETQIYGVHRRIPGVDPPSPQGFEWTPLYLGKETIDSVEYHEWMVCGHATADVPDVNVVDEDGVHVSVLADPAWVIPHQAAFTTMFGAVYRDIRSHIYGVDRRYTMILAEVGNADADACAAGEKTLTCFVDGVEPVGDGSGEVITDRFLQYYHFFVNNIAHSGSLSYQSGSWLTNPTSDVFGVAVPIVDSDSFTAAAAIGEFRIPAIEGQDYPPGFIGAAIIGATAGERNSRRFWVAEWNRSCGCRSGVSHLGQWRVDLLHPTQAAKDAAPLYTDAYEHIDGTFGTELAWSDHANRIAFKADREPRTGEWRTSGIAQAPDEIINYEREILSQERDYPFAPGIAMAFHLANMESIVRKHPPKLIRFEVTVGPDTTGDSLGYRDLFSFIRYRNYDAIATADNQERLGLIVRHQVQSGGRKVLVDVFDCEELIDFDTPPEDFPAVGVPNETCAAATVLTQDPFTPAAVHQNTSAHATDVGIPAWSGTLAYHAAWFEFTPWADGTLFLTTVHSDYDTQLAVFTGDCGDLTEIQYNDNDPYTGSTSVLEFAVTSGVPLKILVAGYGPSDGGNLSLGHYFTEPE